MTALIGTVGHDLRQRLITNKARSWPRSDCPYYIQYTIVSKIIVNSHSDHYHCLTSQNILKRLYPILTSEFS